MVIAVKSESKPAWLCAFYVSRKQGSIGQNPIMPHSNQSLSSNEITAEARIHKIEDTLRASLPDHMIPKQYIAINEIPITCNGKVNFEHLNEIAAPVSKSVTFATNETIELKIENLWSELLNIPQGQCDPTANFYDLGGDSLAFSNMLRLIRKDIIAKKHDLSFSRKITMIISNPTRENIVRSIESVQQEEDI